MPPDLLNPILPLIAAAVAGVFSYLAGRSMKTHEWKLTLAKESIVVRRRLYAEFVGEADRLLLQSMDSKISKVSALGELTTKFGEISLLAPDPVVEAAKAVCDYVISAHSHGAQSKEDRNFYQLKQDFIAEARKEIAAYERG